MGRNSNVRKKTGKSGVITKITEITPSPNDIIDDTIPLYEVVPQASELKATATESTPPPEDAPAAVELKVTVTESSPPPEDTIPLPEDTPAASELKATATESTPPPEDTIPLLEDAPAASELKDTGTESTLSPDDTTDDTIKMSVVVPAASEQKALVVVPRNLPPAIISRPRKSWAGPTSTVSISSSKNDWRKRMLFIVSSAVVLLFIATGISYLVLGTNAGSANSPLTNLQPSKSTAIVTIVPLSTVVKNTYTIAMVTGQPNISQIQAEGARTISDSQSQSLQVNATGKVTTPATSATGTLAFSGATKAVTIPAGTPFLDKNKIALVLNAAVTLPVKGLAVNVGAHANPAGSKGNVPALDINGNFCYPNCATGSIFLVHNTAFAGGKDALSYTFVQQSDINNAASQLENSLTSVAQGAVLSQIKASEQLVGSISCGLSSLSADQTAGTRVPNVTVSVTETCLGEVYSAQRVQVLAVNLLKRDVTRLVGPGYVLVDNVLIQVLTQPKLIDTQGTLSIKIMATGTAFYQFTTTETQAFAKLIAGQSLAEAQALLLTQTGVAHVTINISDNPANKLPNDPGKIAFVVLK